MAAPQGLFTFPGIKGVMSGSLTWQIGAVPSMCTIKAPMQPGPFPERGTLLISYGGMRLVFPQCKLADIHVETTQQGFQLLVFRILDRRWKWQNFGDIRGRYNVREGRLSKTTLRYEKKPRELARLCWEAMGELRSDNSQLPDDARPLIDWDGLPSQALQVLAEARGCRINLNPLSNMPEIIRVGLGRTLPKQDVISDSFDVDPPELPDEFAFQCGDTLWEMFFKLEAVTEQHTTTPRTDDGKIVPIDEALFKPRIGWEKDVPPNFTNVTEKLREHAKKTIYRYWRPIVPIKQWDHNLKALDRIRLEDRLVRLGKVNEVANERLPAVLYGRFWDGNPNLKQATKWLATPDGIMAEFKRGFSIDTERSLVITSEPLYRYMLGSQEVGRNAGGVTVNFDPVRMSHKPAVLYLHTAVAVRDEKTNAFLRHDVKQKPKASQLGTKPFYVKRNDTFLAYWYERRGSTTTQKDNKAYLETYVRNYLFDEIAKWQLKTPGTRVYAGIVPIATDGAITEVTWAVDDQGYATTTVSRNREQPQLSLTYEERREIEFMKELRRKQDEKGDEKDKARNGK